MYFFNSGLRVLLTIPTGPLAVELAVICASAIIPFIVVAIAGNRIAERISPAWVKRMVLIALIAMGARYAIG